MGISVPIGAEHYDKLKRISDQLGLGLKKTMEYLVSYYWQKEIEWDVSKLKEVKPNAVESREVKPIRQLLEEFKPNVVESRKVKPIRQLLEELGREYNLLPSKEMTSTSLANPKNTITSNSRIIKEDGSSQVKPTIRSLLDKPENCSRCGSPKRPSAKFCYNCGSIL